MIKKRASQGFLEPIQKRAVSRSVQLEAVYLEALLYYKNVTLLKNALSFFCQSVLQTSEMLSYNLQQKTLPKFLWL